MREFLLFTFYFLLFTFVMSLTGCGGERREERGERREGGDTIPMRYARNLVMVEDSLYIKVILLDPWHDGKVLHSYLLCNRADSARVERGERRDERGELICLPLRRNVVFNAAHASLLCMLGATGCIAGVADLKYMNLPEVRRRVESGERREESGVQELQEFRSFRSYRSCRECGGAEVRECGGVIVDCGDSMTPDVEQILEIGADAVWLSPFEGSSGYGCIAEAGIPLIECADYMESSALGRAEWMRFYGLLVGRGAEADSLFRVVERHYLAQVECAKRLDGGLKILPERLVGTTWFVPGGRSSMGRLISDAGGVYAWSDDGHSGSLSLSFETVLDKSGDADVWVLNYIGPEPLTYDVLAGECAGYAQLKAFRDRNVYYVNSLRVPYFEEVSFRPDWLLADYVALLHGLPSGDGGLRYLRRVKN